MFGKNKKQIEINEKAELTALDAFCLTLNKEEEEFAREKKVVMDNIHRLASRGSVSGKLTKAEWDCFDKLIEWLEGLGYECDKCGEAVYVRWGKPIKKANEAELKNLAPAPSGISFVWEKDEVQYDYICYRCKEHSEYATRFCPNCGAKMIVKEG